MQKTSKMVKTEKKIKEHLKDFLMREYVRNRSPGNKIAKQLRVCNDTVYTWLRKHKIRVRSMSDALQLKGPSIPTKMQLTKWCVREKKSAYFIAKKVGVSHTTVYNWLKRFNISVGREGERH